jgi:hypothetical protein
LFINSPSARAVGLDIADNAYPNNTGLLRGKASDGYMDLLGNSIFGLVDRYVPTVFSGTTFLIVLSQDGKPTSPASVTATNPATVPTTVVAATNDNFVYNGVTYTVAPGTYSTIATLAAAMSNALHTATPLSSVLTITHDATTLTATDATGAGLGGNGLAFATGTHDFLAASGFANAQALAGGTGGPTGATQGAGILYLVTARF